MLHTRLYNVTTLLKLEAEDKTYRATCITCEAKDGPPEKAVQQRERCKICQNDKPVHAFTHARRHQSKSEWICVESSIQLVQPAGAVRSQRSRRRVLDGYVQNARMHVTHHVLAAA